MTATGAPAPAPASPPPPPATAMRWRGVIGGLLAFLLIPAIPQARALLPIEETMLLVMAGIAACTVVGWLRGGPIWLAVFWCAVVAWTLGRAFPGNTASYRDLVRGWTLLASGGFAVASVLAKHLRLLPRALVGVLVAFGASLIVAALQPGGLSRIGETVAARVADRNSASVMMYARQLEGAEGRWRDVVSRVAPPEAIGQQLEAVGRSGVAFFPALLALETLAALALSWAVYHRIARTRIGEPAGPLREFRFNDQLVWGLIAGLAIAALPAFGPLRGVGRNLLVFFGALYALRALGVLQTLWGRTAAILWVAALIVVLPEAGPVMRASLVGLLLAVGVSDTWVDWRRRVVRRPGGSAS